MLHCLAPRLVRAQVGGEQWRSGADATHLASPTTACSTVMCSRATWKRSLGVCSGVAIDMNALSEVMGLGMACLSRLCVCMCI